MLDPQSKNAVVGMPPEMLEETGRGAEGVSPPLVLSQVQVPARDREGP